jgi:hypothetical protein
MPDQVRHDGKGSLWTHTNYHGAHILNLSVWVLKLRTQNSGLILLTFLSKVLCSLSKIFASEVRQKSISLLVIPGLTRNPALLTWIPAFAGMTAPELF